MILSQDNFSNVKVTNGKVISDGSRNIVVGVALPGLSESIGLSDTEDLDDIDIPDYVEVEADTTNFKLDMTAAVALPLVCWMIWALKIWMISKT